MVPTSCQTLVKEVVRLNRLPAPFILQGPPLAIEMCSEPRARVQCLAPEHTAGTQPPLVTRPHEGAVFAYLPLSVVPMVRI